MKRVLAVAAAGLLVGCAASEPINTREFPPRESYTSSASVDEVLRCMRANGPHLLQFTAYPGSGSAEVEIQNLVSVGGPAYAVYLTTIEPSGQGSLVSIRFSGEFLLAYSEKEWTALANRCAPPA